MNTEDLSNLSEQKVEEVKTKEEEKANEFLTEVVLTSYKNHLLEIHKYLRSRSFTLQQLREEISEKLCKLSSFNRQFVKEFKDDFIVDVIYKLTGYKHEINSSTSEVSE